MKKRLKWIVSSVVVFVIVAIIVILCVSKWVTNTTKSQTYSDIATIPSNKTGLLLGTSKYFRKKIINPYYQYRIDAAVNLYRAGKIQYIIVSGDNSSTSYNEPEQMKKDLIARGIPPRKIFLDYAGLHTLDSIIRCRDIFGEDHFTIISQAFHNERAIFIADHKHIHAIAYNARGVEGADGYKVQFREQFSRIKMVIELLLNTQPKYFYGNKIQVK